MNNKSYSKIYDELGVKPVINTCGNMTLLGGSMLSPKIGEAMLEANRYFVDMNELLEKSGKIIAEILGAEAAYVTPGCAAAIALGASACIAGNDPDRIEKLPDTTGMKNEILIQRRQRYKYDRCLNLSGAKIVEIGDASGSRPEQLEAAIGPKTAAIHYLAPGGGEGVIALEEVIRIGKRHSVPTIVDAAAHNYPIENLKKYTKMGADLVCYGAKYFGAPNSTGILCGRKDLVESAARQGFIGFESSPQRSLFRPMKLDRQEIIAVVVALKEWINMDHEARFKSYDRRVRSFLNGISGLANVKGISLPEGANIATGVRVTIDEKAAPKTAAQIANELREGNPSIWVNPSGDSLFMAMNNIVDGDELVIAERLKSILK